MFVLEWTHFTKTAMNSDLCTNAHSDLARHGLTPKTVQVLVGGVLGKPSDRMSPVGTNVLLCVDKGR